jgi:cell division protein FtsW (lipid II flippase)
MQSFESHEMPGASQPHSAQRELILLALAAVFVLLNSAAISIVSSGRLTLSHLYPFATWVFVFGSLLIILRRFRPSHDPFLLPIIGLLSGWGLVILDRLLPAFLHRQVIWIVLASLALLLAALLPSSLWFFRRYRYLWLLSGLALLTATLIFGVNPSGFGSQLWLRLPLPGLVYFQPSELLKLLMIIFLASYFDEQELYSSHGLSSFRFGSIRSLAPLIVMWFFSLILLVWQRDLGAAALFFVVFLALLYLATGNWRYVAGGLVLLAVASAVAYFAYDVVAVRFDTWWNPWPAAREEGYQIVQSLYALASGNMIGQGIGQGYPTYVPVAHTDFTFAAVAEEWGLIGGLVAVISFALISYRGFKIAINSSTSFRMYMAAGISLMLGIQSLLILGGITRLLPLTGVTLPFVSYGGSSLVMSFLMVGFLLNLSSTEDAGGGLNFKVVLSAPVRRGISQEARDRLRHLSLLTILAFSAVFLLVVYWTAVRGSAILERDDNPRLVEAEQRINRGSILDANGVVLAESRADPDGLQQRLYHSDSGPGVGYYSFGHGQAGIESAMDAILRGGDENPWDRWLSSDLLHEEQVGRDVRLTIDASWQQLANDALADNQGAIVLLSLPDNDVRAMASQPIYDANILDEQFEVLSNDERGPLINRAVQGQYQPGLTIQPFVMAMANESGIIDFEETTFDQARSLMINGTELDCAANGDSPLSWAEVLRDRCPGPMTSWATELGTEGLYDIYRSFGLTSAPSMNIGERSDDQFEIEDLELAVIGQDSLAITPIQLALALTTLANDGSYVEPKLVEATQDEDGNWRPFERSGESREIVSPSSAAETLLAMSTNNGFIEHSVLVLSGPSGSTDSWYLGLAPAGAPRFAVVVVLEENDDIHAAEEIGRRILNEVLGGE